MNSLELLTQYNIAIPFQLGKTLGAGIDGTVYEIANSKDRVVKLSIHHSTLDGPFDQVQEALKLIQETSPKHLVKVYAFGQLLADGLNNIRSNYTVYWIEMEQLFSLSEDEKKVCHTILSHEDAKKNKDYTQEQLNKILAELGAWLDCDMHRMAAFCLAIIKSQIIHHDIHPRNIMKDKDGNFKLIDLNRITIKTKV